MALVSEGELLAGSIWSEQLGAHRPLADGLLEVMQELLGEAISRAYDCDQTYC